METLRVIGKVSSVLKNLKDCPLQESEGAPESTIIISKKYWPALSGLQRGDRIQILTWLHKGRRSTLQTRPRNNPKATMRGVFATRSPDRPNPIGLHEGDIISIEDGAIRISNLEVINGTPVIDIKPML